MAYLNLEGKQGLVGGTIKWKKIVGSLMKKRKKEMNTIKR